MKVLLLLICLVAAAASCFGQSSNAVGPKPRTKPDLRVVMQFEIKCPTNFSLSLELDKLKLVGHQTAPLPDLSGTWAFDASRSKVSKSLSGADETIEIKHTDPEFRIRRYQTINGKMTEKESAYFTDGRGETNPATIWLSTSPDPKSPHPGENKSKTKWSGGRIVTRTTLRMNVGIHFIEEEVVDEWTLSADGKTLTQTTKFYLQRNASRDPLMVTASHPDDKRVYSLLSK